MSWRSVGFLRTRTEVDTPSPTLVLLLALLGEGYNFPECARIMGVSLASVKKWAGPSDNPQLAPGRQTDFFATTLLARWREHVKSRTDTFPIPPDDLRTLLLL